MGLKISGLVKFTPNAGGAGDANLTISNASYSGTSFLVGGQDTNPRGIFFNDVGTKMFIVGRSNDQVYQYTLSTGFDLSSASYDSVSLDISSQDDDSEGIFFNSGGTKMFIVGRNSDRVHQYTLGSGFDLSTASYDSVNFDVSGQGGIPTGIFFNDTGTKMFMVDSTGSESVYQYTLGTGFDLSTTSYDSVSLDISNEDTQPRGIFFNSVGTKMFMVGRSNDRVYQYTLGTPFDLSTASYDSISFNVSGQDGLPNGIFFNPAGTKMFMVGAGSNSVYQYNL